MNRTFIVAALVAGALTVTSCAAGEPAEPETSSLESSSSALNNTVPCNLGESYDAATASVRARYDLPVNATYYFERYGEWVANESCTDAQVLAWQGLRRETGESDEICRVVYDYNVFAGTVSPIGCVVPVMVVTDAAR